MKPTTPVDLNNSSMFFNRFKAMLQTCYPNSMKNLVSLPLLMGHLSMPCFQCHACFDQWQKEHKHFVCRIKAGTAKTIVKQNDVCDESIVFYDAVVLLGSSEINQTKEPVRLVGYEVDGVKYWVATSRFDLSAEQIAFIYKLRWDIEIFFYILETPLEGLPSDCPKQTWTYGPDPCRLDNIFAAGHLLP